MLCIVEIAKPVRSPQLNLHVQLIKRFQDGCRCSGASNIKILATVISVLFFRSLDFMNWFSDARKTPPLAVVCASLPSARPPPSRRSPMPTCNATPDLRVGSPTCKANSFVWHEGFKSICIFVGICLCVYLCNSSWAYVLFQRGDLLLPLHQFELQVTHLPVWISCEGINHLWPTGHIEWKNTSTPRACCAGLLTLEFYRVWFSAVLQNFTIRILRSIPLGLLIQLGL